MLATGNIIDGRYTLLRRLDQGGMGEVWVARESGARDVALKFILAGTHDPGLVQRFLAEVHTAASLRSPHMVVVYHWGTHADSPYMAMELLRGSNLAEQLRTKGRIADVRVAVDYVVQACEAMAVAHAQGVIHRDLKPANLFLDEPTRQIKVLDFGVAKATHSTRAQLTRDGSYVGTLAYSAPEQLANAADVTPRSDIWSIGAILYELLAGVPAFPEAYPELMTAILQREPRPLREIRSDISEGVARCVARCLAKNPDQRFADVEALIRVLAEFGGRQSLAILARLPSESSPAVDSARDAMPDFHSEDELVKAVFEPRPDPGGNPRRVVFMLGAGFSMPAARRRGVPGTNEIVALIQKQLRPAERAQLSQRLEVSHNRYQDAFELLAATHSADVANSVIREAVLRAYKQPHELGASSLEQQRKCQDYEDRREAWEMPPGVEHLGLIIARGLAGTRTSEADRASWERFSHFHLTTNFDPLLAVAIRKHQGVCIPFVIDKDFPCPEPQPGFCALVHLHGRWTKGDTLHNNLSARREQLERSLGEHLERSVLVVIGYGGWDDVFMRTLEQVARSRSELDVLWSFFDNDPLEIWQHQRQLITRLGQLGPRIKFYRGVDSNRFFERLATRLEGKREESADTNAPQHVGARLSRRPQHPRWVLGGALAMVAGLIGAWLLYQSAGHSAAPALPPTALPAPPGPPSPRQPAQPEPPAAPAGPAPVAPLAIRIQCDFPTPPGAVQVGAERIEIAAFCPAHAHSAEEHGQQLLQQYPLLAKGTAKLEPKHPFYDLSVDSNARPIAFHLLKRERAVATLRLTGKGCAEITRADVVVLGRKAAPPSVVSRLSVKSPGGAEAETCEGAVELPFDAFHAPLRVRLTPSSYAASSTVYDADTIEVRVERRVKPTILPTPKSKANEDCLPPKYCPR